MYKIIDVGSWKRKEAFHFFKKFEDPFFNLTANVDVTNLYRHCKNEDLSFSLACLFYSQSALNRIPEFRLRLVDDQVVEFDSVHATQTILNDDETFSFCYFENCGDLKEFDTTGRRARAAYGELKSFDVEADRVDLIYYSVIPWVSFTSFKHASRLDNTQSVPRIVFGRMFDDGPVKKMPVSVEAHHSLMDGIHVGKYFAGLQSMISFV